jgi:phosphatidylinositol alpha-mannosyltransferase
VRIGIVCPYDVGAPGGVQQLTGELGAHLLANGDEVVFVAAGRSWFHGGPGLEAQTFYAGRAISVRANRSRAPVTLSPLSWPRVRRALATADVVHVHEPLVPLVGWMGLSAGKPLVATFHADPPRWVTRLYRIIPGLDRSLRRSIITAVSQVAAKALPPSWGQVRIVPNAIDVASYAPSVDRETHRVAFLGRDDPRKGLSLLLEAWPAVRSALPDAELIVMGASRKEPQPGVEFLGPISGEEKRRLLASSQVYVAPNLGGESFGIVVVEGMAAGCAVVSSDVPAFVEVGGDVTVRVPAGDANALATAVSTLLVDPTSAREMGKRARRRAAAFDWSAVMSSYRGLYEQALS